MAVHESGKPPWLALPDLLNDLAVRIEGHVGVSFALDHRRVEIVSRIFLKHLQPP
jgi:hypothetical protein